MSTKMTMKQAKSIPIPTLMRMIHKAKQYIKTSPIMIEACKEYDFDIEDIDLIPVAFKDIDTSATTAHGVIYLSYDLLLDGFDVKDYSYLIHESVHHFQQCLGTKPTKSSDDGNYLDNKHEQESFTNQVGFIADELGEDEAEEYVDDLLEYHEVDSKKEKKEKKDIFMEKV